MPVTWFACVVGRVGVVCDRVSTQSLNTAVAQYLPPIDGDWTQRRRRGRSRSAARLLTVSTSSFSFTSHTSLAPSAVLSGWGCGVGVASQSEQS